MKKIRLGIAGLGTVGGGLLEVLETNKSVIAQRTGCEIEVTGASVRDINKVRPFLPKTTKLTTNSLELAKSDDIDIFVELMGGIAEPKECILAALANGKSIVTANKALLAEDGEEIFALAAKNNLHVAFEAAVAGGIPIVETLKESLNSNSIQSFLGILNGTSNYILSEMSMNKIDFDTVLKTAQELGYAEAEPSLDIDGFDAAHKLNLLIRLAWGVEYPYNKLHIEGIRNTSSMDIEFAKEFGYRIKLLGQASLKDSKIEAGLFPALVNEKLLLAQVKGAFNAIKLEGNAVGSLFLHGAGAGALPTASSVLADILAIAKGYEANNFGYASPVLPQADILPSEESVYPYYLRLMVNDNVGVLRDVAGAFANENISIAQVIQKPMQGSTLPLVFITHEAPYKAIQTALKKIENLHVGKAVCYRIFNA